MINPCCSFLSSQKTVNDFSCIQSHPFNECSLIKSYQKGQTSAYSRKDFADEAMLVPCKIQFVNFCTIHFLNECLRKQIQKNLLLGKTCYFIVPSQHLPGRTGKSHKRLSGQ